MSDMEDEPMDIDSSIIIADSKLPNNELLESSTCDELINTENTTIEKSDLPPRWENKGGTFTTGIDIFSNDEKLKMKERAKRFGIDKKLNNDNDEIIDNDNLYKSMNIIDDIENKKIRLNALHMKGTNDMSTKDVFKYFEHYGPATIEWINDESCNIVWLDDLSASRALIHLSKKIDDEKSMNECENNKIIWRKGNDYKKINNNIFLRFATINDKKKPNSEKQSEYYKKYGNPNFGGVKGLLTASHKKLYKQKKRKLSDTMNDDDGDADDDKNISLKKKNNPWGELSENWSNTDNFEEHYIVNKRPNLHVNYDDHDNVGKTTIKHRLGVKNNHKMSNGVDDYSKGSGDNNDNDESSDNDDDDDDMSKRSKIPRMRMHADDEEKKVERKKLKQINQKKREESRDLRSRIGRRKSPVYRDEIQVIVTNKPDIYSQNRAMIEVDSEMLEESEKEEGELEDEINEKEIEDNQLEQDKIHEEPVEISEDEEEEGEIDDDNEKDESSTTSDSDLSEKEVQGPKGSVIKVVTRAKPQVASTVWTRLNVNSNDKNNSSNNRGNLSDRLKGDLRSRIGNPKKRERSPLRIEVRNEKYEEKREEDYSD